MTWSEPEALMIKSLLRAVDATDKNVNEIKEAIVGSLKNGGKPGLQDAVRDVRSEVGVARGELVTHQAVNAKDHKFIRRAIAGVGIFTLVALLANIDAATPILGWFVRIAIKIFT